MKPTSLPTVAILLALGACAHEPDASMRAGTVLAERSHAIGHGFATVSRSQVSDGFERVGHFTFVYFHDDKICQCNAEEVSLAPNGGLLLFTDTDTGKLSLYRTATRTRVALTEDFVGYPAEAMWDLATKRAIVRLVNGPRTSIEVQI